MSVGVRPSVLVVDDDASNLAIVATVLQSTCRLRLASSGERALLLAEAERPDLILLDVEMPGVDGYTVCRQLKANPALAAVPVIFLTGRATVEDETHGFACGGVDYIHKPISPPLLAARVRTQLSLQAALAAARSDRAKADSLLEVVLPKVAADELRRSGTVSPRRLENVAVIFCDIAGFTAFCDKHEPELVVQRLDAVIRGLEVVARSYRVDKLRTIGDGFMAAVGILEPDDSPLATAVRCSLELAREVARIVPEWRARVGVGIGPVVSGIVGGERYQFDVWGEPVNVAAALVGVGAPGSVCLFADAWRALDGEVVVTRVIEHPASSALERDVIELCAN